jgi:fluoroacetyl-CoA thioesterase
VTVDRGLREVLTRTVGADDTARALGSGDLAVLATPRLLGWFEAACVAAVESSLAARETTVGTRVQVEHSRPSAEGATVRVTADLVHVDGRLLRFEVVAEDEAGAVLGHGQLTRVVVERERFLARLQRQ